MTEFACNNKQYLSTGESLFLINPGRYSNISGKELGSLEKVLEADEVLLTEKKTNEVTKRSADKKIRGSC